jgi:hypothetical protein
VKSPQDIAHIVAVDPLLVGLRNDAVKAWEEAVSMSQGYLGMIPAGTKEAQDTAWRAAVVAQALYTLGLQSVLTEHAPEEAR